MKNLRNFIKEEIKQLMQDDALLSKKDTPGLEKEKSAKHESYMAKPQIWQLACQASDIYEMLQDNEAIDDWSESHIAQASQMINAVYQSLYHKKRKQGNS